MSPVGRKQSPPEGLETRLEFETLISDLSSRFVDLPAVEVDSAIEDAQRRVCEFLGVGRGSGEPPGHGTFPWIQQQALAGRAVVISSLEELPGEAAVDVENARRFGLKSGLILPLSVGGEPPVGVLTRDAQKNPEKYRDLVVRIAGYCAYSVDLAFAAGRADRQDRRADRLSGEPAERLRETGGARV